MMLIIYVAYPVDDMTDAEIIGELRKVRNPTVVPVVPFFAMRRYLNLDVADERAEWERTSQEYLRHDFIDELWLYGERITSDMRDLVLLARKEGIKVVAKSPALVPILEHIRAQESLSSPQ